MAEYALIDGYLESLRASVQWRRDIDDLVAEVEDHLYSAVERFVARGTDLHLAQRRTLERFGDPDLLAAAFASTPRGGIAVPTKFTKTAGLLGIVSAVLLLTLPIAWSFTVYTDSRSGSWDTAEEILFGLGFAAFLSGLVCLLVLMVGLSKRHGGLGIAGLIGIGLAGLGAAAVFIPWFIVGWGVLLGAGMLVYALTMLRRGIAPRLATIAFGSGMLLGVGVFLVLDALEFGGRDSFGDYPAASLTGIWVMCLITSAGVFGLSRWLHSEQPADIEQSDSLVTS
jgi:hypothetical protein